MSRVRSKDSQPELALRRLIYGLGFRYRLHRRELPGTPDIVFVGRRKAIFMHGCFWHRHADPGCRLARMPKSRQDFWIEKLARNAKRDAENELLLKDANWDVLTVWECQLKDPIKVEERVLAFLGER